ncbi:MAG: SRPBCC family protein [Dehalococcoidia bacterium]
MSIDVSAETIIDRPRAEVAAYVVDPANEPSWIGGIVESQQITPGPIARGSRVRRVAKFLGRRIEYAPEVTEFVLDERLSMRTDKPFPMIIEYAFSEEVGGTRVRTRLRGGGSGFFRIAGPLLARAVRRNIEADLRRLRALLEAPDSPQAR